MYEWTSASVICAKFHALIPFCSIFTKFWWTKSWKTWKMKHSFFRPGKIMEFQNSCMEKSWKKFWATRALSKKNFTLSTHHPMMILKLILFVLILMENVWQQGLMWSLHWKKVKYYTTNDNSFFFAVSIIENPWKYHGKSWKNHGIWFWETAGIPLLYIP